MTVAAYIRVSSPRRLNRQTTDSQRARITEYARSVGLRGLRWYEDYASGRSVKRTALQRLLEAAHEGELSQIVVTDLSRFSRSVRDTLRLIEELTGRGIKLSVVNQGLTLDRSAMSQFLLTIFAALAQLDSDVRSERIKAGLELARSQGTRLGRKPNKARRATARKLAKQGLSTDEIAQRLGIKSRQGVYYLLRHSA